MGRAGLTKPEARARLCWDEDAEEGGRGLVEGGEPEQG